MEQLCVVDSFQLADTLQLEQDNLRHQNIGKELPDLAASKPNRHRYLALNREPSLLQRLTHGLFVNAFKKPMTQFVVDVEEHTKNLLRDLAVK